MENNFSNLGLHYNKVVVMTILVNGEPYEMEKITFKGLLNPTSDWLHFICNKSGQNHLCKIDQFPRQRFRIGRENRCEIIYHE